jgi:iron complex transport system substrate-binding protein
MTTFLRPRLAVHSDGAGWTTMIWSFVLCALMAVPAIAAPPLRVVSQTVGTDELLLALADPAQIAALSHLGRDPAFSLTASEAAAYPKLKSSDAESVIFFRPDLVLAASYTEAPTLALLRRAGVALIVVDRFESFEDVYANIRGIGAALGHPDRAEALVRSTQQRVADLARRLHGVRPVRVLAVSTYPFTAGSQTTFHATTPDEKLLAWNPEVLIASDTEGPGLEARLRQIPAYRHLPALEAGRLVLLPGPLLASVTHHRVEAFEVLARKLHPERFQ